MLAGQFTFTDYVISIGTTTLSEFTTTSWQPVTEYYRASQLQLSNSKKGWIYHEFSQPFEWDGESNIVVQITRSITPNLTVGAQTRYTAATNKVLTKNDNTNSLVDFTGTGTRSNNRPDVKFKFKDFGCQGDETPVYVAVIGQPAADAAIS